MHSSRGPLLLRHAACLLPCHLIYSSSGITDYFVVFHLRSAPQLPARPCTNSGKGPFQNTLVSSMFATCRPRILTYPEEGHRPTNRHETAAPNMMILICPCYCIAIGDKCLFSLSTGEQCDSCKFKCTAGCKVDRNIIDLILYLCHFGRHNLNSP